MPISAPVPVFQSVEYDSNPCYDIYKFQWQEHLFHVLPHLEDGIVVGPYSRERDRADRNFADLSQRSTFPLGTPAHQEVTEILQLPYLLVHQGARQLYCPAWQLIFRLPAWT